MRSRCPWRKRGEDIGCFRNRHTEHSDASRAQCSLGHLRRAFTGNDPCGRLVRSADQRAGRRQAQGGVEHDAHRRARLEAGQSAGEPGVVGERGPDANQDGIVPPATARAPFDAIGSDEKELLCVGEPHAPIAHADLFVATGAQDKVFARIANFLLRPRISLDS